MICVNLARPYHEDLHRGGLPYILPRDGFLRYGLPNATLRPNTPLRALFMGASHPDTATVYVDDDRDGIPVAVVRL